MNKEDQLKSLGERIKNLRVSLGLTQSELAHRINKDREVISRIERGVNNPTYLTLLEVCKGLDVSLVDLIKEI